MWIIFACLSAFFAGITAVISKCGIKTTDSSLATALRTIVIIIFSWLIVVIVGSFNTITTIENKTLLFIILSGLSTGASWICYFKALQLGSVNKVVPIDKSSTILTIILAIIFFNEGFSILKLCAIILISLGIYLMIEKKDVTYQTNHKNWIIYALLSAIFASLTAILGKMGISNIESNLGTAIRTSVVLIMAWILVFMTGKTKNLKHINRNELFFIFLSGITTGASWLCYYNALQNGTTSVVVAIDKLSIIVTVIFSYFAFKERLSKKSFLGLMLLIGGTILLAII